MKTNEQTTNKQRLVRRSIDLPLPVWHRLEALAQETQSIASKGSRRGKASWRAMLRRLAVGELTVAPLAQVDDLIEPLRTGPEETL